MLLFRPMQGEPWQEPRVWVHFVVTALSTAATLAAYFLIGA